MSTSEYDRSVRDILDRVAKGHLSSEEAATLIAALRPSTPPGEAVDEPRPTATGGETSAAGGETSAAGGEASAANWADAVDSPDAVRATTPESVVDEGAGPTGTGPATGGTDAVPGGTDAVPAGAGSAGSSGGAGTGTGSAGAGAGVGSVGAGAAGGGVDSGSEEGDGAVESEHSNVPMPSGVRRVTVRAIGRRVRLVGEPAVTGVAVDGPHVIKRDGDTLSISSEGDMGVSVDGLSLLRNPTNLKSHVNGLAKELWIRVNPQLDVEVEVTGGSVQAERLPGLSRVRVTAGAAKVSDVDGPIDVLVQAGSANLDAQITKGRSRVRVESGAANVVLRRGSDVRVHTEAQLGRVSWTGAVTGQSKDVEIGRGRAALDVEVLVGSAQITSD